MHWPKEPVIKIPVTVLDGRLVKRVPVDVVVAELGVVAVVVSGATAEGVVWLKGSLHIVTAFTSGVETIPPMRRVSAATGATSVLKFMV